MREGTPCAPRSATEGRLSLPARRMDRPPKTKTHYFRLF